MARLSTRHGSARSIRTSLPPSSAHAVEAEVTLQQTARLTCRFGHHTYRDVYDIAYDVLFQDDDTSPSGG